MPRNQKDEQAPGLKKNRNHAGKNRKQKQEHQQHRDGKPLQDKRDVAKQPFAENGKKCTLHGQDEDRGEQAAAQHRQQVACKKSREVRRVGGRGKNQWREHVGIEQKAHKKNSDGRDSCLKELAVLNGQGRQHKHIEQIGKEQIPLEDSHDAHGDEGIEDKKEMVVDLQPIRRQGRAQGTSWLESNEWVIDRPKIYRHHEPWNAGGYGDEDQARLGVAVRRGSLMVEEALQKVAYKQHELAAFGLLHWAERSLGIERERFRIGHRNQALEFFTDGQFASPPPSLAQWPAYLAA
jgi:hypothetical protein